jgi:hypothetical protein
MNIEELTDNVHRIDRRLMAKILESPLGSKRPITTESLFYFFVRLVAVFLPSRPHDQSCVAHSKG